MSIILLNCVWFNSILEVLYEDCLEKDRFIPHTHGIPLSQKYVSDGGSSDTFCKKWKISLVVTSVFQ